MHRLLLYRWVLVCMFNRSTADHYDESIVHSLSALSEKFLLRTTHAYWEGAKPCLYISFNFLGVAVFHAYRCTVFPNPPYDPKQ